MINVSRPFLPPQDEYQHYLDGIWKRNWLTNNGPLVNQLELQLKERLGVDHLLFLSNGTIAIQIAIKALDLKGEIITTPFSYVATTSSIVWEGCTPVFVDIDPHTFNIDPASIEAAITPQTSAILATHVYGNPCDVEAIAAIAQKHGLKVIYDAAHCFGVTYKGNSIFTYGDIVTTSFHATKVFHTIEGGAVITSSKALDDKMSKLRNFGHDGWGVFDGVGINGKNSEYHAAMGLCNLKHVAGIIKKYGELSRLYDNYLEQANLQRPVIFRDTVYNHAYYPVVFDSEQQLLHVMEQMERMSIGTRRYFYPLLSQLDYVTHRSTPVAERIAPRILCLPLFFEMSEAEVAMISKYLIQVLH
jgi:dTDP-4-amino-4,6-dideoxygalactose transaminase